MKDRRFCFLKKKTFFFFFLAICLGICLTICLGICLTICWGFVGDFEEKSTWFCFGDFGWGLFGNLLGDFSLF